MSLIVFGVVLPWLIVGLFGGLGAWIGFQPIHQNGRLLARLEVLEQRLGTPPPAPPLQGEGRLNPAVQSGPPLLVGEGLGEGSRLPSALPIGSLAPDFELSDLSGGRQALSDFRGRKLLLVFYNPRCGFCTQMAPDLAALCRDGAHGEPLPLVVSTGDPEENRLLVEDHSIRCPILLQEEMEIASQYQCHGTPMGYLIDEQGRIASELAVGAEALLALSGRWRAGANGRNGHAPLSPESNGRAALGGKRSLSDSKINREGLPVGTPAPAFRLPRLDGGELTLEEYRGRRVLLVFSDPHCGPCDQLAPHLEQFAKETTGVQVLMVGRGEEEANRSKAAEHGLTFPVALQRQWEVSREYAMFGIPIGYLINEVGRIAADVAVGVEPIRSLLARAAVPTNGRLKEARRGKPVAARRR